MAECDLKRIGNTNLSSEWNSLQIQKIIGEKDFIGTELQLLWIAEINEGKGTRPVIMILLCFIAPWLAMFLRGKIIQGILCIILHITLIGWIPATIWALIVTREPKEA